jgi:hypothetical protein
LLIAILVASALLLGLPLRSWTRRGDGASALRLGPLLAVVRPAAATPVVAEAALAFAARTVSVKLLLRAPGDFAATGVVLRHERSG